MQGAGCVNICSAPPWSAACLWTLSSGTRSLTTSCAHPSFLAASRWHHPQLRLLFKKQNPSHLSPSKTPLSCLEGTTIKPCQAQRGILCLPSVRSTCCRPPVPCTVAMPASLPPAPSLDQASPPRPAHSGPPLTMLSRRRDLLRNLSCLTGPFFHPLLRPLLPQDVFHARDQVTSKHLSGRSLHCHCVRHSVLPLSCCAWQQVGTLNAPLHTCNSFPSLTCMSKLTLKTAYLLHQTMLRCRGEVNEQEGQADAKDGV